MRGRKRNEPGREKEMKARQCVRVAACFSRVAQCTHSDFPQTADSQLICGPTCARHIDVEDRHSRCDRGASNAGTLTRRLGQQVWPNVPVAAAHIVGQTWHMSTLRLESTPHAGCGFLAPLIVYTRHIWCVCTTCWWIFCDVNAESESVCEEMIPPFKYRHIWQRERHSEKDKERDRREREKARGVVRKCTCHLFLYVHASIYMCK